MPNKDTRPEQVRGREHRSDVLTYPAPTPDQKVVAVRKLESALADGDLQAICDFAWVRPDIETLIRQIFPWLEALSEEQRRHECSYVLGLVTPDTPEPTRRQARP